MQSLLVRCLQRTWSVLEPWILGPPSLYDSLQEHLRVSDVVLLVLGYCTPRPRIEVHVPIHRDRIQKIRPHLFLEESTGRIRIVSYGFSQDFIVDLPAAAGDDLSRFGWHDSDHGGDLGFLHKDDQKPEGTLERWLAEPKLPRGWSLSNYASSHDRQVFCRLTHGTSTKEVDLLGRPKKISTLTVFRLRSDQKPLRIALANMPERCNGLACDWNPRTQRVSILLRDSTQIWWTRFQARLGPNDLKWQWATHSLFWKSRSKKHSFHAVDAQSDMAFRMDWDDGDSHVRLSVMDLTTDFIC